MKLGRTSWALLIGGVLLIIFVSLGFTGTRQMREQEKLADELTVAEQRVAKLQLEQLTAEQEQLQIKLKEVTGELSAAQQKLHQPNESIDAIDFIFEIADSCKVTIDDINSTGLASKNVSKINFSTQGLTLMASGEALDLISFISRLNTDFTTGLVESADITIPGQAEEGTPSARIQLSVYNYLVN